MTSAEHHALCDRLGANAWHTSQWAPEQRAAYMAAKLEKFRHYMRWLAGYQPRRYMERGALIDAIRHDVRQALKPPPSETYRVCPCHPRRYRNVKPEPRHRRSRAEALAYLETFKP